LRWFKSEANPGEKGLLHRDHGSDLSEGRVSGITHCARGTSGFGDGISCVSFLTICNVSGEVNGIAQASRLYAKDNCLPDQGPKLQNANHYQSPGKHPEPPIGRRLVCSIIFLSGAFVGCLLGGKYLYDGRTIIGAALFACSGLLGSAGFVVWGLSLFPSTWEWWL